MPEVRPLNALHYDLARVGSLDAVAAPPYDVIDAEARRELVARSPFNVVELDLPEDPGGGDPYEHAGATLEKWIAEGVLVTDGGEAVWALEQEYDAPDGSRRTRHGVLARVRVSEYGAGAVRPHERTQPGPREDRLRLTRATRHNLSPIFSLHPGDAWRHVEAARGGDPWGEIGDDGGTVNRVWRIADSEALAALSAELADAELLIADGHHRYETARAYAEEVGGEGPHRYTLMCLVSLSDPGLTVFGYHRLLRNLEAPERHEALAAALREHFEIDEVALEALDPAGEEGPGVFGYVDAHLRRGFRLRLKEASLEVLEAALGERSAAYRRLDAVILETLVLGGALGMSAEDIAAKRGIGYAKSAGEAIGALDGGWHAAFLMRPTPVEQVRAVAAAGETMPPKSTFFFPKIPTGIAFNPLS